MRYTRRRLIAVFCLLILMGCTDTKKQENKTKPSLKTLNTSTEDPEQLAGIIVQSLPADDGKASVLRARLDQIHNPKIREGVLVPLYDRLNSEDLKLSLLAYYKERPLPVVGTEMVDSVLLRPQHFSEFMEVVLASAVPENHRKRLQNLFRNRPALSQLEMLQFSEILMMNAGFSESARVLTKVLHLLEEDYLQRGNFVSAKLDFFQKDFKGAAEKLPEFLPKERFREDTVEMLVDSLIMMEDLNRAFHYLKVYSSYTNEEEPKAHVLRGKLFLFAKNYRESHRQWERARELGSRDQQYWLLSFFLSHYFPEGVPRSEMGPFVSWHQGRLGAEGLDLYRYDIFLDQYQKLSRYKQELLPKLRPFSQTP